ncbi:GDP-mannose 4,6-dehydratase [Streptomyces sp. IBSBF 3136]|uniref:GDP-mannose 4,6-dehydratase n=1 Tax=Streptomyces sp. IBSBF 3136 TaxID=2903524 RepID=UPI002FDC4F93
MATSSNPAFLDPKLDFVVGDICDPGLVDDLMARHTAVVHVAVDSHVDRSFTTAGTFVTTNVIGTQTSPMRPCGTASPSSCTSPRTRVYGPLLDGAATEDHPLAPTVPYAASDLVALSYWHTYGAPVCVTRSSNNYGSCQHPEKIIPLFVTRLLRGEPVTLHGEDQHIRNWLHVEDDCAGIELEETTDWYRRNADRWAPLSRNFRPAMPCPRTAPASEKEHQHAVRPSRRRALDGL